MNKDCFWLTDEQFVRIKPHLLTDTQLLFTDVAMPGRQRRQARQAGAPRRPDVKVLFTTGYTRNAVVHNGLLDPGVELIGKPFTVELAAKVRQGLDAPGRMGDALGARRCVLLLQSSMVRTAGVEPARARPEGF